MGKRTSSRQNFRSSIENYETEIKEGNVVDNEKIATENKGT
jgi:hypothetical protein